MSLVIGLVNALQNPPALHIACTRPTVPAIEGLIVDLKAGIEKVKSDSGEAKGDMVTLYGMFNQPHFCLQIVSC